MVLKRSICKENLMAFYLFLNLINTSDFLSQFNLNDIVSLPIQSNDNNLSSTRQILPRQNIPSRRVVTKIIRVKRTRLNRKTKAPNTTMELMTTPRGLSIRQCGRAKNNPNNLIFSIMNGQPAARGAWPWIVSLRLNTTSEYRYKCVGTIISSQFVLTAAHCLQDDASNYVFVTNTINLDQRPGINDIHHISRVIIHPLYSATLSINDIALVKLSKPLSFSDDLMPVCLPESSEYRFLFEKFVFIAGWGSTTGFNGNSELSNQILEARLQIISDNTCRQNFGVNGNYLCALDPTERQANVCFGDSGSGLVFYNSTLNRWILYGVANYVLRDMKSIFRCNNRAPSIYAIVPQYIFWINTMMLT